MLAASGKYRRTLELLSAAGAALAIAASIEFLDQPVIGLLHGVVTDAVIDVGVLLGALGSPIPYFLVSTPVFLFLKFHEQKILQANRALFVLLNSTTAPFFTDLLKPLFGRSRPHLWWEQGIYTFRFLTNSLDFSSFPSEHATVAAAMAGTLSTLLPEYRPTFFLLATIVAFSRVVIGVHYPSDVIAGILIGSVSVAVVRASFRYYKLGLR